MLNGMLQTTVTEGDKKKQHRFPYWGRIQGEEKTYTDSQRTDRIGKVGSMCLHLRICVGVGGGKITEIFKEEN